MGSSFTLHKYSAYLNNSYEYDLYSIIILEIVATDNIIKMHNSSSFMVTTILFKTN